MNDWTSGRISTPDFFPRVHLHEVVAREAVMLAKRIGLADEVPVATFNPQTGCHVAVTKLGAVICYDETWRGRSMFDLLMPAYEALIFG